jgi:hypothetical protein
MFKLGPLLATPGALNALQPDDLLAILQRHAGADWGDLDAEDRAANDAALPTGSRLLTAYNVAGRKVWIITEADRSARTVLLPEEY